MPKKNILVIVFLFVSLTAHSALAAFVNNVETFDGNVKDTDTWEEYIPYGGKVTWDNQLILEATPPFSSADYTTKQVTVGIGEGVRVELVSYPSWYRTENYFCLTSNSEKTFNGTVFDSHVIALEYFPNWTDNDFFGWVGGSGEFHGTNFGGHITPPSPGNPLILEIMRVSEGLARFSVYYRDMIPIGSVIRVLPPDMPDNLYISLYARTQHLGGSIVYDNVTIIPEPTTLLLLGLGGLALQRKREI